MRTSAGSPLRSALAKYAPVSPCRAAPGNRAASARRARSRDRSTRFEQPRGARRGRARACRSASESRRRAAAASAASAAGARARTGCSLASARSRGVRASAGRGGGGVVGTSSRLGRSGRRPAAPGGAADGGPPESAERADGPRRLRGPGEDPRQMTVEDARRLRRQRRSAGSSTSIAGSSSAGSNSTAIFCRSTSPVTSAGWLVSRERVGQPAADVGEHRLHLRRQRTRIAPRLRFVPEQVGEPLRREVRGLHLAHDVDEAPRGGGIARLERIRVRRRQPEQQIERGNAQLQRAREHDDAIDRREPGEVEARLGAAPRLQRANQRELLARDPEAREQRRRRRHRGWRPSRPARARSGRS